MFSRNPGGFGMSRMIFFSRKTRPVSPPVAATVPEAFGGFKNWMLGDVGEVHWSEILIKHEFFHKTSSVENEHFGKEQ